MKKMDRNQLKDKARFGFERKFPQGTKAISAAMVELGYDFGGIQTFLKAMPKDKVPAMYQLAYDVNSRKYQDPYAPHGCGVRGTATARVLYDGDGAAYDIEALPAETDEETGEEYFSYVMSAESNPEHEGKLRKLPYCGELFDNPALKQAILRVIIPVLSKIVPKSHRGAVVEINLVGLRGVDTPGVFYHSTPGHMHTDDRCASFVLLMSKAGLIGAENIITDHKAPIAFDELDDSNTLARFTMEEPWDWFACVDGLVRHGVTAAQLDPAYGTSGHRIAMTVDLYWAVEPPFEQPEP